jgi:small subunit ribosomal protein S4
VENVLRRRLQTMVHKKGLATTAKGARQFVIHGHIALDGKKLDSPSYIVKRGEEDLIGFYQSSPVEKQYKARTEKTGNNES